MTTRRLRQLLLGMLTATTLVPSVAYADTLVNRLGGANRYETMSSIAMKAFDKSSWAIVATGENYPDALAASGLAGMQRCPIILSASDTLSPEARERLVSLGTKNVYIVGGQASVSEGVESQIAEMGIDVKRAAGADRADTIVKVMQTMVAAGYMYSPKTVIVATGDGFADALSISPWAWSVRFPILLTQSGRLTEGEVNEIRQHQTIEKIVMVGGVASVSEEVRAQLGDGYEFERVQGADRYGTSAAIAEWMCSQAPSSFGWVSPAVATGQNFPDALAGAVLQGLYGSPLLLVSESSNAAKELMASHRRDIAVLNVLGGESSVSAGLVSTIMGDQPIDRGYADDGLIDLPEEYGYDFVIPEPWRGKVNYDASGDHPHLDYFSLELLSFYPGNDTSLIDYIMGNGRGTDYALWDTEVLPSGNKVSIYSSYHGVLYVVVESPDGRRAVLFCGASEYLTVGVNKREEQYLPKYTELLAESSGGSSEAEPSELIKSAVLASCECVRFA